MPRKSRREIVGDGEDADRAASERNLAKLERELHEAWESRDDTPDETTDIDEPTDEDDK